MRKSILKIIGIPDNNQAKVLYNDGFFQKFALFFDGNSSFLENISFEDADITTLYLGGEKQFENINLPNKPDVIINMICDPECQKKSLQIFENLHFKAPILNQPKNILKTARDTLSQNLPFDERFIIPKTYRVKPTNTKEMKEEVKKYFGTQSFLLRPVNSHGGEGLIKVDDIENENFTEFFFDGENEYFITEFIDFQSDDGYYKKARFFLLAGKPYPRHYIFSNEWKIHSQNRDEEYFTQEERSFLENPPTIFLDFCHSIYNYLQLDFFGIDCAILPNGKIVLFEANVCMRPFAKHKEEYLQNSYKTIIEQFGKLL